MQSVTSVSFYSRSSMCRIGLNISETTEQNLFYCICTSFPEVLFEWLNPFPSGYEYENQHLCTYNTDCTLCDREARGLGPEVGWKRSLVS